MAAIKPAVTVVGSLNMDLVIRAPRIARPGETLLGQGFLTVPGGKGANQAVAAARLGTPVAMIGRVGRDAFGDALLSNLQADGIDHRFVLQDDEAATGVAMITVGDDGQNSIVVAPEANAKLSPADVEAAEATIADAKVLLLQLESPLQTVVRAAEIAAAHGVVVVLNPAPAQPLPERLYALVDYLIPNESETAQLSDLPVEDAEQAEAAAAALQQRGVGTVILTLGERGAVLTSKRGVVYMPGFTVETVDTTAAGDAFVGGFAVALAEGRTPEQALRWASAAGALAVTKLGAQPSLPVRDELLALLEGNGGKQNP